MFFSKLARVIAVLGLVLGLVNTGIVVLVITQPTPEQRDAAFKAFIPYSSTGKALDRAIYVILASLALGTLAEIGILTGRKVDTLSGPR